MDNFVKPFPGSIRTCCCEQEGVTNTRTGEIMIIHVGFYPSR
jgi:hypothetical protein